MGELHDAMPSVFGKEAKRKNLLKNLEHIVEVLKQAVQHNSDYLPDGGGETRYLHWRPAAHGLSQGDTRQGGLDKVGHWTMVLQTLISPPPPSPPPPSTRGLWTHSCPPL